MNSPRIIGITGASGFIGQCVVQTLTQFGHVAVAFSRNPERRVEGCVETRGFDAEREIDVAGLDGIVHLAGESVFGLWTSARRRRIFESRREGTRALVDSISRAGPKGPKVLVSASATGIYGNTREDETDESRPPASAGFLAEVAKAWETEALRAETGGVRVVILRIGLVLGSGGGAMKILSPLFRAGLGGKLGSGQQWVSWIDVSDLGRLFLFAIENPEVHGILNATSPEPIRNAEFTQALARKFHRKAWLRAPEPVLKLLLGDASHLLLDSQRVIPRRAQELGFQYQAARL